MYLLIIIKAHVNARKLLPYYHKMVLKVA